MFGIYTPPEKYRRPYFMKEAPGGETLTIEWFGTAGFRLVYRDTVLLIDPYFTRSGLVDVARRKLIENREDIDRHIDSADHIVIGHSHYDHMLDVPYIASKTGALVSGSDTTANLALGWGLPKKNVRRITPGKKTDCGEFKVTFIESVHGQIWGVEPAPGVVESPPEWPLTMKEFKHGGVFIMLIEAGPFRILHNGSANLIDENLNGVEADIQLVGLSGRTFTRGYFERMYKKIAPKYILPMHYDFFFMPLSEGMRLLPFIKMEKFFARAEAQSPTLKIIAPRFFEKVVLYGKKGSVEAGIVNE